MSRPSFDPQDWPRVQELFARALELPPEDRTGFLERIEPSEAIRSHVVALLEGDADPATVLAESVLGMGWMGGTQTDAGADESADPAVGSTIGPYRCVRKIGEGGMGVVYLAERVDFEQRVALKIVKRGMDTNEIVRRFEGERRILARLEHPHIARLLDGGVTDDGRPWFSMEYVEGEPLLDHCVRADLPVVERLELFRSVCQAVQYAHASLVVHRDLKPTNILVTPDGTPKLLDFGIAKVVGGDASEADPGLTRTGFRPMSPAYASPEQVLGEPVTTASDVYALGVILYELLTGERPFGERGTGKSLEADIVSTEPRPPSQRVGADRKDLPADLDNIVLMALRKEPGRRYESAGALAADVGRYLAGYPIMASGDSALYRLRTFVRRNRTWVGAAAAAVLVLSGTVTWYTARLRAERDRAELEAAKFQAVNDYWGVVFEEASPLSAQAGRAVPTSETTVADLLDWAAANAEGYLGDYPDAYARVLLALGYVSYTRGDYERAEPVLRRGLQVTQDLFGDSVDDEIVMHTASVAIMLADQGRWEESLDYQRRTLDLALRYDEPLGAGLAYNNLGKHLTRMGRYEEALPYLEGALRAYVEAVGEDHFYWAIAMGNYGRALWGAGDLEGADSALTRALAVKHAEFPKGDLSIAEDQVTLAWLRRAQGRVAEALAEADSALAIREPVPLDDRSIVGESLQQRGLLRVEAGDVETGLADLREGDRLFREQAGKGHPLTYQGPLHLGTALRLAGRAAEAETQLLMAVKEADDYLPAGHPGAADPRYQLGLLSGARGDEAEAERWLREALDIREAHLPEGHRLTSEARAALDELRGEGAGRIGNPKGFSRQ